MALHKMVQKNREKRGKQLHHVRHVQLARSSAFTGWFRTLKRMAHHKPRTSPNVPPSLLSTKHNAVVHQHPSPGSPRCCSALLPHTNSFESLLMPSFIARHSRRYFGKTDRPSAAPELHSPRLPRPSPPHRQALPSAYAPKCRHDGVGARGGRKDDGHTAALTRAARRS